MRKLVAIGLLLFSLQVVKGQENRVQTERNSEVSNNASEEGTFQIQAVNTRNIPLVPGNLPEIVRKNRHATQVKYVSLGANSRVMILPESQINKPGFKPLQRLAFIRE